MEIEETNENDNTSLPETATDALDGLATAIPAPLKKNFLKAVSALCTAAVEIPVSALEGRAAENRAETAARVKIIETGADQIAAQMKVDPEYASIAVQKYGSKIIRERINVDKAVSIAQDQLEALPAPKGTEEPESLNDDWLNAFETEASQKSTEEMQKLFGKILAGEIQRPNSFSLKTLKLMGDLDSQTAALFRRLCSYSFSFVYPGHGAVVDARVPSLGGNAGSNSLLQVGLGFDQLNILSEYGLIITDYNSYYPYDRAIFDATTRRAFYPFQYRNKPHALVRIDDQKPKQEFRLHGVALSKVGRELFPIVDILEEDLFTGPVVELLKTKNLKLRPLPSE